MASLFGLAPDGGYLASRVTTDCGGLLPHRFALTWSPCGAIGGIFSVALSIALGLSTCCARPLAGILLYGARTFLHAHEAHSGCLADFHGYYIATTLFIFNTLQIIFRLALICHRAHPKIAGERNEAFLAGAISNLRFLSSPASAGLFFVRLFRKPKIPIRARH